MLAALQAIAPGCYHPLPVTVALILKYPPRDPTVYGRALLGLGFLSAPFAGPGAAVLTSAGWLVAGSEEKNNLWAGVGLVGLLGVSAILAARYGLLDSAELSGIGGVLLLLYEALAVAALWHAGIKCDSMLLKLAAVLLAASWLLAVAGSPADVDVAAKAASGALLDWAGTAWASEAAKDIIHQLGGAQSIARAVAAAGGVLAGVGMLFLPRERRTGIEEVFEAF